MDAQLPCITECLNHFRFTRDITIIVFYIATIQLHLPIRGILNSIRRIKVDALHLPLHSLAIQQGIHHQQAISLNQSVLPIVAMPVVTSQSFQFILLLFLKITKQVEL